MAKTSGRTNVLEFRPANDFHVLALLLDGTRRTFRPGETVSGEVAWDLPHEPAAVVVRLFWHTSGRGTTDLTILDGARFEETLRCGRRRFGFTLPSAPYSFCGRLISLTWGVEAVVEPTDVSVHEYVVVSPTGVEVVLASLEKG